MYLLFAKKLVIFFKKYFTRMVVNKSSYAAIPLNKKKLLKKIYPNKIITGTYK